MACLLMIFPSGAHAQEANPADTAVTMSYTTYEVREGDNLLALAKEWDISPEAIQRYSHLIHEMNGTKSPFRYNKLVEGFDWTYVGDVHPGDTIYFSAPEPSYDYPAPIRLGDWSMEADGDEKVVITNTMTLNGYSFSMAESPLGYLSVNSNVAYVLFGNWSEPATWFVREITMNADGLERHRVVANTLKKYSPVLTSWRIQRELPGDTSYSTTSGYNFSIDKEILYNTLVVGNITLVGATHDNYQGGYLSPLRILAVIEGLDEYPSVIYLYGNNYDHDNLQIKVVRITGDPVELSNGFPTFANDAVGSLQYYPSQGEIGGDCQAISFAGLSANQVTGRCNGQLISLNDQTFVVSINWNDSLPAIFLTPVIFE